MKRRKIYYVPGLISIIGLPILLAIWGPDDPVQLNAMRLFLPSDRRPPRGTVSFNRYEIMQVLKKKKIVEVDLDDRPSRLHPEYNAYRKSSFVLQEMNRLQFTHDTSEILKVSFTDETCYGEFVWALNNATVFCFRRYFYFDDALYLVPNPPPPPTIGVQPLYVEDIDLHLPPPPPPPTRWQLFKEWAHWRWMEIKFHFRYNYLLIAGFLLLIVIPGITGTVRRYRANRPHLLVEA